MKLIHLFSIAIASSVASCAFNSMYLQPARVSAQAKKLTMSAPTGTTSVHFSPGTYQPTFIRNGTDTLDFDFTIESVVFTSASGNKLNGWMLKPKNIAPTVTLLHFHGNAGFVLSQYQAVSPLIKYGFQVFTFDYSGYGFSEGKATRQNVLTDANSALTYVKGRPDVKNTSLVVYGQSLGGHLSAVVAQQRQSEIDGLVIEGAFSSHKDIAASRAWIFGRMAVSEKYSASRSIGSYNKPVLIIHSTEDKVIPFRMGKKLFAKANEPKEFYEIRNCHICGPDFYGDSISHKIMKMLDDK